MALSNDSTTMVMPVAPAYQGGYGYGNGCGSMWGGDWASWIILFLIFGMFGWGGYGNFGGGWGNGFGGGFGGANGPGFQGYATRSDINEGFALQGLQNGQTSIKDAVTNGFHGVDNAVCQLGYNTQQGFNNLASQLASCCCETQSAIQGVRYDIATSAAATQNTIQNTTRDIIDNQTSGINAIMGKLSQMEYNGLNDKYQAALAENQSLKLAASQSNQNAVLMAAMDANKAEILRRTGAECPTPAYVVQPPQPVTFPNFCNPCSTCGTMA